MKDFTVNPGSNTNVKILSTSELFKKFLRLVLKLEFRKSFNILIAGSVNLFYRNYKWGNVKSFECSVCHKESLFFYAHGDDLRITFNSICPNCNSRGRHRGLMFLYKDQINSLSVPISVIHFAPEPVFYPLLRNNNQVNYKTADLFLSDVDFREDIQKLSFSNESYDLVLCNHVIEHVPNDEAALSEMSRILKVGGKAIITIPGNFKRKRTVYFNHLRFNGHYRDYGIDIVKKMEIYFGRVKCLDMYTYKGADHGKKYSIRPFDIAFICEK